MHPSCALTGCSQEYPGWFWLHAPLGIAAFIGGLLGVIWGAKLPSDEFEGMSLYTAHKARVITYDLRRQRLAVAGWQPWLD